MARYKLLSIDSFNVTKATGDVEGAIKRLGGVEAIKQLATGMVNATLGEAK